MTNLLKQKASIWDNDVAENTRLRATKSHISNQAVAGHCTIVHRFLERQGCRFKPRCGNERPGGHHFDKESLCVRSVGELLGRVSVSEVRDLIAVDFQGQLFCSYGW